MRRLAFTFALVLHLALHAICPTAASQPTSCEETAARAATLLDQGHYAQAYSAFSDARNCALQASGDVDGPESARLLNALGQAAYEAGDYQAAWNYFMQARDTLTRLHGEKHPDVAQSLLWLARLAFDDGDNDQAEFLYTSAASLSVENHDARPQARAASGLCNVLFGRGRYQESLDCSLQTLDITRAAFGNDSEEFALVHLDIGVIFFNIGDYESAFKHLGAARDILLRAYGAEHPRIAVALEWLGYGYLLNSELELAEKSMRQALDMRRAFLGENHPDTAGSYSALGYYYLEIQDYAAAREYYTLALERVLKIYPPDNPVVSDAYNNAAMAEQYNGNLSGALAFLEKSLGIEMALHGENHPGTALVLANIAFAAGQLGDYAKALHYGRRSLDARLNTLGPDHPDLIKSYSNLALALQQTGRLDEAEPLMAQALRIALLAFGRSHQVTAAQFNNLGYLYEMRGDYDRALENYNEAAGIFAAILGPQSQAVATAWNNIGVLYSKMRNPESALAYQLKGLSILEKTLGDDDALRPTLYNNIGTCYLDAGDPQQALDYFNKALRIRTALLGERHPDTAIVLGNMALSYDSLRDYENAVSLGHRQLNIYMDAFGESHPDTALALSNLSSFYNMAGDAKHGLEYAQRAVAALCAGKAAPGAADCIPSGTAISALRNGAAYFSDLKMYEESVAYYLTAADLLDRLRASLSGDLSKTAHGAEHYAMFPYGIAAMVNLSTQKNDLSYLYQAADFAERGIGRVFLEMLSRSRATVDGGLPREVLARGQTLRATVGDAAAAVAAEESKPRAGQSQSARSQAYEALLDAEAALAAFNKQLLADYPDYAELMNPTPRPLKDMEPELLKPGGAILEYYLGQDASYLIFDSKQTLAIRALPGADTIEKLVDLHRARLTDPSVSADALKTGARLYELLISPIEDLLGDVDHLLIVPTGNLFFLPFETLVSKSGDSEQFLIQRVSIRYAPSLNVAYLVAERKSRGKDRRQHVRRVWLGYGDPVYSAGDARSRGLEVSAETQDMSSAYTRALAGDDAPGARAGLWLRLPGTEDEVKTISALFPQDAAEVNLALDATEANFRAQAAAGSRYIHMATHGSLGEGGAREPALVLSLVGNSGGGLDGFLTMSDVFNLKAPADLVVLSACKTGQGRMVRGEGVAGMARAFLYAGADALVISLWSVADKETRDFMVGLYERLQGGADPESALRDVKLAFLDQGLPPYYWAPFVFLGGY